MNKTLFKRSLTFATSAAMAIVSVLPSVASVTAADGDLTVSKSLLTNVNVVAAELPAPDTEFTLVKEYGGFAAEAAEKKWADDMRAWADLEQMLLDSVDYASASDWNDKVGAGMATVMDKNANGITIAKARWQQKARNLVASKVSMINPDLVDDVVDAMSDAKVTFISDEQVKVTVTLDEIGPQVAKKIASKMDAFGLTIENGIVFDDWSKFHVSGKIEVTMDIDYDGKGVTPSVEFTDEDGDTYNLATTNTSIYNYFDKKAKQAIEITNIAEDDPADLEKFTSAYNRAVAYAKRAVAAAQETHESGTNLEAVYEAYKAKVDARVQEAIAQVDAVMADQDYVSVDTYNKYKDKVANVAKNLPDTFAEFVTFNYKGMSLDTVAEYADTVDGVDVQLSSADLVRLFESAENALVNITGFNAAAVFCIPDDQAAEVLAAYQATYADEYVITKVDSYKVVTVSRDDASGKFNFDVKRMIENVEYTKPDESTTTETTTTTVETSTTTETTTTGDETESTTETTTTGDGSGTTTETTTTTGETSTTTDTTTSGDESGSTTTTTPATYVSMEIEGIEDYGLIYWSEEDVPFDLSQMSVKLHFIIGGVDQTDKVVDVTDAFKPEGNSAKELGFSLPNGAGFSENYVKVLLQDEEKIQKIVTDEFGEDAAAIIEQDNLVNGAALARFKVVLVLRGDMNLDGVIDVQDSLQIQIMYTDRMAYKGVNQAIEEGMLLSRFGENAMLYVPYAHYASNTYSGNGLPDVNDSLQTQVYYTLRLSMKNYDWDHEEIIGHAVTPLDELHADPLKYDEQVAKQYNEFVENLKANAQ